MIIINNIEKTKISKRFHRIVALVLCFIALFNICTPVAFAAVNEDIVMNKGQEGSLFKSHTVEGYWTIDDESILKKLSDGITEMYGEELDYIRIKALKSGTTNVKFYSNTGSLLAIQKVIVVTPIESFVLSDTQLQMCVDDTHQLQVTINPTDTDYKDVKWGSSDPSIVKVDSSGTITALNPGQARIKARASDNKSTATCTVNVIRPVSSIQVDSKDIVLTSRLDKTQIIATAYPENATNTKLIFESDNENVVKVDQEGYIEAINNGVAIITIKSEDGFSKVTKKVTVEGLVGSITVNQTDIELNDIGETFKAEATINPTNALDNSIIWLSSDEKVATVNDKGLITATGVGKCTITVSSNDKKVNTTLNITVNPLMKVSFHEVSEYGKNHFSSSIILPNQHVKKYSTITLEEPKKHGHVFEGWYKDFWNGTYSEPITDNTLKVEHEQTIYAKFTPIKVKSIKLTDEYITTDGDGVQTLNIEGTFSPAYVANGQYTVTSSNPKVAEVISHVRTSYGDNHKNIITGELKLNGYGTTTITVTTEDGKKTATRKITIGKDDLSGERTVIKELVPEFSLSMSPDKCVQINFPVYEGATRYELIASDSLGNSWSFNVNDINKGYYIDKFANNMNATYSYKMKVYYKWGVSTNCSPTKTFKAALSKPSFKASSNSYNSIKLTINKQSNAKEYRVYRSTDNKNWSYIGKTTSTAYTDSSLTTGKTYYYKIRAYNGDLKSSYSSVVNTKPSLKTVKADASYNSYNSNKITWDKISGASGYIVYRATSKNGTYSSIKTITSGSTTSYINSGLTSGKTYYYKVRAYRTVSGKKVYSSYSSIVDGKPKPNKPNLSISTTSKKATTKWNKVTGANGYEVYRATSKDGSYSKVKTITSGSTVSYTDSKLSSGKTYYYKVRAYRTVSGKKVYSSYSSVKSIKVK